MFAVIVSKSTRHKASLLFGFAHVALKKIHTEQDCTKIIVILWFVQLPRKEYAALFIALGLSYERYHRFPFAEPTDGDAEPTHGDAEPTDGNAEPTDGDEELARAKS
jgi:hypothetical protein